MVFRESLAKSLAIAPVPYLLVEMFANGGSDATDGGLASASAHDGVKASEARVCVLALSDRAVQINRMN